jgi:peptidyl-dipeptidase A
VTLGERIAALEAELAPLQKAAAEASWMLYTTGEERWQAESARLDTEIRRLLSRPEPYEELKAAVEAGGADGEDPLVRRQAVLLLNAHRPNQLPPDVIERIVNLEKVVENRFNTFRAELDGEQVGDNHIREVLERSDDLELRRRAWEASKQIGADVEGELLELVGLRNDAARSLGFPTYYRMMLECDELDEDELFEVLERVEEGTRPIFERYKASLDAALAERFGIAVEELRPWHYADPFFQEAPAAEIDLDPWFRDQNVEELSTRAFAALGFDVRDILRRSDLYEREGKSQHAFCSFLDREDDIRILANITPSEYWTATMLHELGHAVYDQGIDRSLPWFLRSQAHVLTTEASAMLFGRLTRSADWLVKHARVPEQDARAVAGALERARTAVLLVAARWMLVMAHFERALYADPGQPLNRLWWDLVERFQLVRRPEGRDAPDWAAKIHFSVAPAYYQNYLLGEMTASQLQAHILEHVVGDGDGDTGKSWRRYVASPDVATYLRERLYRPGATLDWRGALEHATGRSLDPAPFIAEVERAAR